MYPNTLQKYLNTVIKFLLRNVFKIQCINKVNVFNYNVFKYSSALLIPEGDRLYQSASSSSYSSRGIAYATAPLSICKKINALTQIQKKLNPIRWKTSLPEPIYCHNIGVKSWEASELSVDENFCYKTQRSYRSSHV